MSASSIRNAALLAASLTAYSLPAFTQDRLIEPFDDASQFTVSSGLFSDGGFDFLGLSTGDFGGDPAPIGIKSYTGFTGSFLTGMDLDGEGASLPVVIEWTGIDILGLSNVEFVGSFAEFFDAPGDIDVDDFILVEARIDGGAFQRVLEFRLDEAEPDNFNGIFKEDTNFDGRGDGTPLGNAAQVFTKSIAGTGSTLDLRLSVRVNAGDEDFAVDDFRIRGVTGAGPLIEPFDDASQFTVSSGFFSDGGFDFLGLSNGDFGGDPAPVGIKSYTGFTGSFLTGMDLDGEGASLPIVIEWTGINITGLTSVQFRGDFAEFFDAPGDVDFDDFILVEARIDGGAYAPVIEFRLDEAEPDNFNGVFSEDTDSDGRGDGAALGDAAQTFTKPIGGTGSSLDLRLTVRVNAGDEDFAVDNFLIEQGSDTGSPLDETFDDASGFTTSSGFFSDGGFDFLGISDGADGGDFGGDPAPSGLKAYTGFTGNFLTGMDLDGEGATLPVVLEWTGIDISGITNVQFSGDFAEFFDAPGDIDFDDFIRVEARIDGGSYTTAIEFRLDQGEPDNFNGVFSEDTDLNGRGDGVMLTNAAQTFTKTVAGTGSTLDLRLSVRLNAGDEDFAVDNFVIDEAVIQPPDPEACGDPVTLISAIQGSSDMAPLTGTQVSIEAIVVGDFQDGTFGTHGDLGGFFVQEEDADGDGDPATSEGLFIFQGGNPAVDVQVGDRVRVSGAVTDSTGLTGIGAITFSDVCAMGQTLPSVTDVTLPLSASSELEAVEAMRVRLPQALAIIEYFNFDRFGEIALGVTRQFQPTALHEPGSPEAAALADLNARSRLTLDDGRTVGNPDPAIHPNGAEFTLDNRFRGGDLVTHAAGVLDFRFGAFRLQPTDGAQYTSVNPRTEMPDEVGGSVRVSSFNVFNYFNTIDDGNNNCGPNGDAGCRGADDENERVRQLDKIVSALAGIDADVYGLVELENTTGVEAMIDIVDALNAAVGAGSYGFVDTGTVGTDAIKVGLIYDTATVAPNSFAVLDTDDFVDPLDTGTPRNRPALAQSFTELRTNETFVVVVNHLKSKGSPCGAGDDDPEAGSCNATRAAAAQALLDWLSTDPTGGGDSDVLILGDLNAYAKEDPIDVLVAGGFTDLAARFGGEMAYSFVFSGQLGYLDYALANGSMLEQVTGATEWHINADEPDILDYDTTFKQPAQAALYEPNAFRASDHDPIVVGLELGTYISGTNRNENLVGTDGADVITGGRGRDRKTGGPGADTFVYTSLLDAGDILMDFEPRVDRISLAALLDSIGYDGDDPIADGFIGFIPRSGSTIVTVDVDGRGGAGRPRSYILVLGVNAVALNDAANFVF